MTEDAMELNAEGIFQTEIQLQGITSTLEWLSSRVSVICVKKYICLQCLHSEHFFKVVEKDFFLLEHFAQEGWSPGYFFCCIIYVHLYLKILIKGKRCDKIKWEEVEARHVLLTHLSVEQLSWESICLSWSVASMSCLCKRSLLLS